MNNRGGVPSGHVASIPRPIKSKVVTPTNQNSITINTPSNADQSASNAIVTLNPQPIKLVVDTPTDWPTVIASGSVGVGSMVVALAVGILAARAQRKQVLAATANFRGEWQKNLREAIASYIGIAARISYEIDVDKGYLDKPESNEIYMNLIQTHASVQLLLDSSKKDHVHIDTLMGKLLAAAKRSDTRDMNQLANDLVKVASEVLEKSWQQIRRNLRGHE